MIYKVCILSRFVFLGAFFWAISNYCAEKFIYSPLYFIFYRIPNLIGLLESVFRAIVNRLRACPPLLWRVYPLFFLSAVFMAEWRSGGLARRYSCPPFLWRIGGLA
jgi:hypothetical protein